MYCGNNANNQDVLEGKKILGSRYSCLLKGKSFGVDMPPDLSFLKPYNPIDKTKKYCGNSDILPNDYDRFGGLYECYLKGIGVGKKIKAETYYTRRPSKSRQKRPSKSPQKRPSKSPKSRQKRPSKSPQKRPSKSRQKNRRVNKE